MIKILGMCMMMAVITALCVVGAAAWIIIMVRDAKIDVLTHASILINNDVDVKDMIRSISKKNDSVATAAISISDMIQAEKKEHEERKQKEKEEFEKMQGELKFGD